MRAYTNINLSIIVLPLVVLAGCGDDGNNTGTGGSAGGSNDSAAIDEFGAQLKAALCAPLVECHFYETEADCLASSGVSLEPEKMYVENGTAIFHPEKVDACLAAADTSVCTWSAIFTADSVKEAIFHACEPVFEGTIANGGACLGDEQCISQNCEQVDLTCADACCASKCAAIPTVPIAKIGESCTMAKCDAGAYCSQAMGMCEAQLAEGESCQDFVECKAPAICDIDMMTGMGTCKTLPASGATCDPASFAPCERLDDLCDTTTKTCVTKGSVGAACTDSNECHRYAFCDDTMTCAKAGLTAGQACDVMDDQCMGQLTCLETTKTCGFPPSNICM